MTSPYDLIKRRQPRYKAVSSVTFASPGFFGFLRDLYYLSRHVAARRPAREARGRERGGGEVGGVFIPSLVLR